MTIFGLRVPDRKAMYLVDMRKLLSIFATVALAALAGCSEQKAPELKTEAKIESKGDAKPYPLETCITDGEKLGSMGDPYVFVHEGQEIKLCCKGCIDDFKKNSAEYMKKIQDAQKSAPKS